MKHRVTAFAGMAAAICSLGACADNGSLLGSSLTTSSVDAGAAAKTAAQTPKIDPACIQLTARIDTLRKDGITERVEKASTGKSATVSVKRASLAQMAELDKANAEFQARCSTIGSTASLAPAATAPATAAPQTAAVAPVQATPPAKP